MQTRAEHPAKTLKNSFLTGLYFSVDFSWSSWEAKKRAEKSKTKSEQKSVQNSEQKSVQKSDPVRGKSVYQNQKTTLCLLVLAEPLKPKDSQTVPSIGTRAKLLGKWKSVSELLRRCGSKKDMLLTDNQQTINRQWPQDLAILKMLWS